MNPLKKLTMCIFGDVVVGRVGSKDVESALVTSKKKREQKPIDITPLIQSNYTLPKENKILACARLIKLL